MDNHGLFFTNTGMKIILLIIHNNSKSTISTTDCHQSLSPSYKKPEKTNFVKQMAEPKIFWTILTYAIKLKMNPSIESGNVRLMS